MRSPASRFGFRLLAAPLFCFPSVFSQTTGPPADPHEMVTHEPRTLSKSADRSAAIDLLNHARQNFNLHDIHSPYALKVSFETNGAAQLEGEGTMEELYDGQSHWRWTEQLQDSHVIRIGDDGHVYGTDPSKPVPLRVQLVRSVLLRPIVQTPASFVMRKADVEREGKTMSCLLLSYSLPPNPAPRSWVEREDCIDPATGLLQLWSEAPGIYAVYDYNGAAEFHGHTLPRQIAIFEEGRLAVQARVESRKHVSDIDPNLCQPTAEMVDDGGTFALSAPTRLPILVDPSDGT